MAETIPAKHDESITGAKHMVWVLGLLLLLLTSALYAPALKNRFVNFDDPDYVTRNGAVLHGASLQHVVWAFGTDNPAANWHPLTWISHMLDVQWYGRNPAGHHFTHVLLFVPDVLLLFLFLERAERSAWMWVKGRGLSGGIGWRSWLRRQGVGGRSCTRGRRGLGGRRLASVRGLRRWRRVFHRRRRDCSGRRDIGGRDERLRGDGDGQVRNL